MQLREDPAIGQRQRIGRRQRDVIGQAFVERGDEAQRVPKLVVEAARLVAFFFIEAQLLRFEAHLAQDPEAEAVGTVFLDQVHRVDGVAEALAHLAPLQIEDQRRDEHGRERDPAYDVQSHHHHARDPQEDDLAAGDHDLIGIPRLEFGRVVGPTEDREWPQRAREPRVERVGIARQVGRAVAFPSLAQRIFFRQRDDRVAVGRVPHRQLMAPPHLTRDVPIA